MRLYLHDNTAKTHADLIRIGVNPDNLKKLKAITSKHSENEYLSLDDGVIDEVNLTYTLAIKTRADFAIFDEEGKFVEKGYSENAKTIEYPIFNYLTEGFSIGEDGDISLTETALKKLISDEIGKIEQSYDENLTLITSTHSKFKLASFAKKSERAKRILSAEPLSSNEKEVFSACLREGETLEQWAKTVIHIKEPLFEYAESLAEGVERRTKEKLNLVKIESWLEDLESAKVYYKSEKQAAINKFNEFKSSLTV